MGAAHHAYAQPENDADVVRPVVAHPSGHPELARTFLCSGWHLAQCQDLLQHIRINGEQFLLNVHGDGLLAFALKSSASVEWATDAAMNAAQ